MSARRAVWEVARRELVERSRSRVLRVSLVLLIIAAAGAAVAAALLTGRTPTDDIGLVGARSAALEPAIRAQATAAGRRVHLHRLSRATAASRQLHTGALDLALLNGSRIMVETSRSQPAVRVVQAAVAAQAVFDRLRGYGLTQTQALELIRPHDLPIDVLRPRPPNYDRNQVLVAAGLMALFMALVFFGQAVAQGVTEEKSSRVVELLLTTLSPRRLLAGKILGIGLLALAMLLLPSAAALAAGKLAGGAGLPSAAPETIGLIVLWFLLGYVFYSVTFAAVGALVSRQEDLNTAMLPVNALLIGAFYLAIAVTNTSPNGTVARVTAFVPPLSPMIVPARMILGNMNALELAIAVVLEAAATGAVVLLAARAYERAILRIGAPLKLRRLLGRQGRQTHAGIAGGPGDTTTAEQASGPRLSRSQDGVLRALAVAAMLAGVLVGFGEPVAVVLVAAGLLLLAIRQALVSVRAPKRRPRHPLR